MDDDRIDLGNVKSSGDFEILPAGTYEGIITEAENKMSQKDKITLNLEIAVDDPAFEGLKQKDWLSYEPQALWRVKQLLEAIGDAEANDCPRKSEIPGKVVNQRVKFIIKHKPDDKGKMRARVFQYLPSDPSTADSRY